MTIIGSLRYTAHYSISPKINLLIVMCFFMSLDVLVWILAATGEFDCPDLLSYNAVVFT